MSKREKKIELVKKNINKCATSTCKAYPYGAIPEKALKKACASYGSEIYGKKIFPEDVIGLIDASVLGGKTGVILTEDGVFYKKMFGKVGYCPYKSISKTDKAVDDIISGCNQEEMRELLLKLSSVEKSINVNDVTDFIDKSNDTIELVGDLVEGLFKQVDKTINNGKMQIDKGKRAFKNINEE